MARGLCLSGGTRLLQQSSPQPAARHLFAQAGEKEAFVAAGNIQRAGPSQISRGGENSQLRDKGTAGLREQRIPEKEEKQQVVISRWVNHTAGISLSWSHRCTEENLVWVLSRAENISSPPCPRQVGDPARSHQGKPLPWARLLPESRGKLFDFSSQSFSFTEDTHYKKTSTGASQTQSTPCLPCKAIV